MIAAIIIAFAISVVSGLGIGGGGLFAVYLAVFTDASQLTVQGLNLLFFLFSSGASVTVQLFKRKLPFVAIGIMAVAGLAGALVGAYAATVLPEQWLRRAFGVMLVSGGIISLRAAMREKYSDNSSTDNESAQRKTTERGKNNGEK